MAAGGGNVIIGILSDTHGQADMAAAAVKLLLAAGAEFLIHCGDVCGDAVLDAMAGTPGAFVFGNNDWDGADLARYAEPLGIRCLNYGGTLELGGKRVAVTHGDSQRQIQSLAPHAHYLLTGHSHVPHDKMLGRTRWINPGALYRASVKTVATLDLADDQLQFIEIPEA